MRWLAGIALALATAHPAAVSIDVHDTALVDVLTLLGAETNTNIVADSSVKDRRITMRLENVTLDEALSVLCASQSLSAHRVSKAIIIGSADPETVVIGWAHGDVLDAVKQLQGSLPPGSTVAGDVRGRRLLVSGARGVASRARDLAAAIEKSFPADDAFAAPVMSYRLRYSRASVTAGAIKTAFSDAVVVPDDAQNAIFVKGEANVQRGIAALIRQIDAPAAQVLFEVRVADVRPVNDQSDVGILLGGYDLNGQAVSGAVTYAFARNSLAINARLNALITSGHAQILATPKLLTLNNQEADLLIGETYPIAYFDTRSGGQQVQFVDIGVKLRLTPTIGSDGSVVAEMHPEYSAIEGFVGGYPVLTSRKVDSKLRVNDGETIVLGGLIRDVDSDNLSRVPGLSSIPILGKLFEERQRTHQRDEVVFLITPHVLAPKR